MQCLFFNSSPLFLIHSNSRLRKAEHTLESKINKHIWFVCGTFSCLQIPAFLVLGFDPMPPSTLDGLHIFVIVLAWCTTFVNPIVYFYSDKKFYQKEFIYWVRELCGLGQKKKKISIGMQKKLLDR